MDRMRLSSSRFFVKTVFCVLAALFIVVFVSDFSWFYLGFIVLASGLIIYRLYYLPDKIEFDDECMYICYRKGDVEVKLCDVYLISRSIMGVGTGGLAKVKFKYDGQENEVLFERKRFSSVFDDFAAFVSRSNPNVKIMTTVGPHDIGH